MTKPNRRWKLGRQGIGTIGNLTLVTGALNPSLSNGPWSKKREKLGNSLLVLNRELAQVDSWDEQQIHRRATDLGSLVNKVWSVSTLACIQDPVRTVSQLCLPIRCEVVLNLLTAWQQI